MRSKYNVKKVTDVYIKKLIRKTWRPVPHEITAEEVEHRRWQVLYYREVARMKELYARGEFKLFCNSVGREITNGVCSSMQEHHEGCWDCDYGKGSKE